MFFKRIVDWISGDKGAAPAGPGSGDGSPQPAAADVAGNTREKRRFLRVALPGAQLILGKTGPFPIANLSFGGLRAMIPPQHRPRIGEEVAAQLNLQPSWLNVRLLVRNAGDDELGFAFVNLGSKESRVLADFLRPVMVGCSLREITGMELQPPGPNLRLRWFQGDGDAQIFVWQTLDDEVVKEEFYFCNYVMLWQKEQRGIRVGRMRDAAGKTGYGRVNPQTAVFFNAPPYQALRLGQTIMKSATLPVQVRDAMLAEIVAEERRLHRRYLLNDADARVFFEPAATPGQRWRVVNLSLTSVGFLLDEFSADEVRQFAAQTQIAGHLVTDNHRVPIIVRPRSQRDDILGCRLEMVMLEEGEALAEFLAPRLLGQSLEEDLAPCDDMLSNKPGGRHYVYVGVHNTHVLALVGRGNQLMAGRLVVLDQILASDGSRLRAFTNNGPAILPIERELPFGQLSEHDLRPYLRYLVLTLLNSAPAVADEVREAWRQAMAATPATPGKT